jgi:hypothetical protein
MVRCLVHVLEHERLRFYLVRLIMVLGSWTGDVTESSILVRVRTHTGRPYQFLSSSSPVGQLRDLR